MKHSIFGVLCVMGFVISTSVACSAPVVEEKAPVVAEKTGTNESAMELVEVDMEADGPQGGCSMKEIRYCQGLCPSGVDSCYGNGVGWSTCNCNNGSGYWINSCKVNGRPECQF